jgi:uncharacterized SAM-binding protein YcdF (DUF218 family)
MDNLFFVLSKIAWGLLSPSSLMVWLLVVACLLLWFNCIRAARGLLTLLSVVALLVMAYPVSDWLMHPLETRFQRPVDMPRQVDGIIVLGGAERLALSADWSSAEVGDSAERILAAAELARRYPDAPVIFSGGSNLVQRPGLDIEGQVVTTLLTQAGIDKRRLRIDTRARNTVENFQMLTSLLPDRDGRYVLVTSAFHMPRAVGVARKQIVNVIPYPVDYRSASPEWRYWDFGLFSHLDVLEVAWHEWLGLTAYYLSGKTASWFPRQQTLKDSH